MVVSSWCWGLRRGCLLHVYNITLYIHLHTYTYICVCICYMFQRTRSWNSPSITVQESTDQDFEACARGPVNEAQNGAASQQSGSQGQESQEVGRYFLRSRNTATRQVLINYIFNLRILECVCQLSWPKQLAFWGCEVLHASLQRGCVRALCLESWGSRKGVPGPADRARMRKTVEHMLWIRQPTCTWRSIGVHTPNLRKPSNIYIYIHLYTYIFFFIISISITFNRRGYAKLPMDLQATN